MRANQNTEHSRQMRRMAERLEDGEPVAVELGRLRGLVATADLPLWMADRFTDPCTAWWLPLTT